MACAGKEPLRVHIVDDDAQDRNALVFLLTASGLSVTAHASGADFLADPDSGGMACLITDLKMPKMSGLELLKIVSERTPPIPTIVLSGCADIPMAIAAIQAGAFDVIEKPFQGETLLRAIHEVSNGGSRFPPPSEIDARTHDLTLVERQVLKDIMSGYSNRAIGHDLNVSPRTIELHRASIMTKMQADSMTDLVRLTLSAQSLEL